MRFDRPGWKLDSSALLYVAEVHGEGRVFYCEMDFLDMVKLSPAELAEHAEVQEAAAFEWLACAEPR